MGFEIDSADQEQSYGDTVATSSMKIGTVTLINKETNEFVALGHSTLRDTNKKLAIKGLCYDIEFAGINKGTTNETGNIVATLDRESLIGYIYYDSDYRNIWKSR